jgi:hypothetical protein
MNDLIKFDKSLLAYKFIYSSFKKSLQYFLIDIKKKKTKSNKPRISSKTKSDNKKRTTSPIQTTETKRKRGRHPAISFRFISLLKIIFYKFVFFCIYFNKFQ